ncbi:MAG: Ig-like domain-containing protein [Telluria sp.]
MVTTQAHDSVGTYEPDYHFDFSAFAGKLIDTFRVYYTTSNGDAQTEFNLVNFTISGYSTVAPVSNTAPTFIGSNTPVSIAQNATATSVADLLHASDTDSGQTLTWSQNGAPSHGSLTISNITGNSGSTDIAPGGTLTYTPSAGFAGTDSFTVQVSDGTDTATRTIQVLVAPGKPGAPVLDTAADSGSSSSDHITNSSSLSFSGTSTSGDSSSTVRVFVDANGNGSYDPGTDPSAPGTMSNGTWTASGLGTSTLNDGTYHVYAVTTSADGTLSSATSDAFDVTIDKTAPTVTFSGLALAADTGASNSDFITSAASQTISASLSAAPGTVETVYGSLDNGVTWTDLSAMVSGTTLSWTGVTLSGSSTLLLRVVDTAGNAGTAASHAYTLDASAPAAPSTLALSPDSDKGASNSDALTNVTTPVITGTGENGATVTLYDSNGTTVLGTDTVSSGHWSITTGTLSEGPHTLSATQTDAAGNVSSASSTLGVVIDTTAPSALALSTSTVLLADATAGATLATLSATDTQSVAFSLAAGNSVNDADNSRFTIVGNAVKPVSSLMAGTYHVYISATDAAGNHGEQAFTIDVTDAPAVSSIVRTGGASAATPASATSVDYTVTFTQPVTGVDTSDFALAATGTASGTISSINGSGATYTVTVNDISGDGSLRLNLNSGATGIQNGSSITISGGYTSGQAYTLDHTAPAAPSAPGMTSATDSGASASDHITGNATPEFTGTGEVNATVTLYDTDGTTVLGSTTVDGFGNWRINSSTLSDGSHTLTAKQTDTFGNVSNAGSGLGVVIDTAAAAPAAPALASDSDSGTPGDHITNHATPTITGTAEANASVTLYDTNGTTVLGTTTADPAGHWSITSNTLSEGSHTLTARQTDVAGNSSSASNGLALTIDTVPPSVPGTPMLSPASDTGTQGDGKTENSAPVITGTADANATVKLYDTDGTTVLGTATADGAGHWSITSSALAAGTHTLTAKAVDVAGNVSAAGAPLALTIQAPAAPPGTTIDGMQVTQQSFTLPGGGSATQTVIPIVSDSRVDSSGNAGVADIPLVSNGTSNVLLAQLPVGFGLTAMGSASQPAGNSLEQLINAIKVATPDHPAADQNHLTGNGAAFLNTLAASTPLLVQTITPQSGTTAPAAPLTLTGTAQQHTALVIDGSHLAAGSQLVLNKVDFAAIIGTVTVTGNTNGQTLTGDGASQHFTVSGGSGSAVFSGGGDDVLAVDSAVGAATPGTPAAAGAQAAGTTILHGGQGNDTAVFSGASSDYTVESHDGYEIVTAKAQPNQHALVVNAETLQFSDTTLTVQNRAPLTTITGLYQTIFGRQGDYLGVESWATAQKNGESMGKIALDMINSTESQHLHSMVFTGDSANDVGLLYQAIFNRQGDAAGLAFWTDKMAHGVSLEQVAQYFVTALEMDVHTIAVQNWDFQV